MSYILGILPSPLTDDIDLHLHDQTVLGPKQYCQHVVQVNIIKLKTVSREGSTIALLGELVVLVVKYIFGNELQTV